MPTALRTGPYRIYFYTYDCDEPRHMRHMHIDRERRSAKFWLDPNMALEENHGYSRKELRGIEHILRDNLEVLRNKWVTFYSGYTRTG